MSEYACNSGVVQVDNHDDGDGDGDGDVDGDDGDADGYMDENADDKQITIMLMMKE